jgi:hypothetical protein
MNTAVQTSTSSQTKAKTITGWVLGLLPCAMMVFSATMKFLQPEKMKFAENWIKSGYPINTAVPIGIAEIACVILYLIPKTRYFGGVMMAAYLGGAVATHVRLNDIAFLGAVSFGIIAWVGLWLRDPRFRQLAPFAND